METPRKQAWSDIHHETVSPLLSRRLVTGERTMVAQVYLKEGCLVPAHEHDNEQVTYILEGGLRFWFGPNADAPTDENFQDVMAGDVVVIPGGVRHRAYALTDTLDLDVFTPPRQDWLNGTDAYLRAPK
jgi:quercetin dioxygenase-like cupin family protein